MQVSSSDPSGPLHLAYNTRKRDAQAEYLGLIKRILRNTIQNVNFADPIQCRRAHESLMHDVNRHTRYIDTKYSMQIDPLYFERDEFI